MPSCDGSNCGACSACNCIKEYVHLDKREKEAYEKKIKELEKELSESRKVNEKLAKKLLD